MLGSSLLSSSDSSFFSGGFSTILGLGFSFYLGSIYVFGSRILYPAIGEAHAVSGAFFPPDSFIYSGISTSNLEDDLLYLTNIQIEIITT